MDIEIKAKAVPKSLNMYFLLPTSSHTPLATQVRQYIYRTSKRKIFPIDPFLRLC